MQIASKGNHKRYWLGLREGRQQKGPKQVDKSWSE